MNPYLAWAMGCVRERKLLSPDAVLTIPRSLATCPKCDGQLYGHFEAWVQRRDGSWACEEIKLDCESEPVISSRKYMDWLNWHYDMPYVDWLPLEVRLTRWVNARYSFDLQGANQ